MGFREKIEDRIRRKQQEIREYETRIAEASAYIEGLQDALRLLPRESSDISYDTTIRSGSRISKSMELLKREGRPMHVTEILKGIGVEPSKKERVSLSGSLGAYVRRNEVFSRPAPNVFGLIGMEYDSPSQEPPAGFGRPENDHANDPQDIDFGGDDIPFQGRHSS